MDMEQSPFKNRWTEHTRKLAQLYRDVEEHNISSEEAQERLEILKEEQRRLRESSPTSDEALEEATENITKGDDMGFTRRRARKTYSTTHALNFKCQCKRCVRMHTITLADRDLLQEMKISWGKTAAEETTESSK